MVSSVEWNTSLGFKKSACFYLASSIVFVATLNNILVSLVSQFSSYKVKMIIIILSFTEKISFVRTKTLELKGSNTLSVIPIIHFQKCIIHFCQEIIIVGKYFTKLHK